MANSPITLAVAEDHHVTMQGIASWFANISDFSIVGTCSSRSSVIKMLDSSKPDLLLLDLHMPGDTPLEELIQSCSQRCNVVVFSAENRPFFVRLALDSGAAAFVLKSQDFGRLVDVLREVNNGKRGLTSPPMKVDTSLTPAERDILKLLAQGMKYDEIAEARGSGSETVRKQCDRLLIRLGLRNREQLIVWATENGFSQRT